MAIITEARDILWPTCRERRKDMITPDCSVREVGVGRKKILLVDDHQDIRELLAIQLRFFGWEVTPACSGRKALEKLKDVRPDLILLDMCMPEMDGFELAQLLKKDPVYRDIPILGITAMEVPEGQDQPLKAGCDDCISKPFRFGELRERVSNLLCKSARPAAK